MSTMKVKTAELTGPALDWAVAEAEDLQPYLREGELWVFRRDGAPNTPRPRFSESWAHGGPLIDMYKVEVFFSGDTVFCKLSGLENAAASGDTPLIAACRAIVMNKLGDEVEVPAELVEVRS